MDEVNWQTRENTPSHLWPEKVQCPRCAARVAKQGVRVPEGIIWVCENGHDDVLERVMEETRRHHPTDEETDDGE